MGFPEANEMSFGGSRVGKTEGGLVIKKQPLRHFLAKMTPPLAQGRQIPPQKPKNKKSRKADAPLLKIRTKGIR